MYIKYYFLTDNKVSQNIEISVQIIYLANVSPALYSTTLHAPLITVLCNVSRKD